MIRVLVCDDHLIVRQGIKQVLADATDIDVAGEAANGPDALARVRAGGIDVVLLDIAMPQRDGLDVLKALKAESPRLPVLMLSTYPDRQYAVRSLKLGAAGYLNKSADSEQLIDAIRRVAQGKLFITPGVAELMAEQLVPASSRSAPPAAPLHERLSHREYQVFRLLAAGRSVGEIAEQLVLSSNTVSTYPDRQYAVRSLKLGAAGYLNKSADSEQLIDAIRRVAQGKLFITPGVAELMAEQLVPAGTRSAAPAAPLHERLSHREYQVFRLLAAGRSVGEIAEQLVLSSNTVSTYRARILEKTGVRNDVELALYAVREGL